MDSAATFGSGLVRSVPQHRFASVAARLALLLAGASVAISGCAPARTATTRSAASPATAPADLSRVVSGRTMQPIVERPDPAIAKIREEGLEHSKVMDTLDYLCNVIGPRLTASPNAKRANQWTRDQLESWGLTNAHLEPWGPFGRGWEVRRYSLQVVEPMEISMISYPKAWSPGLPEPLLSDAVYIDATSEAELEKYRGKLKGKIVLLGTIRNVEAHYTPLANRLTDEELAKLEVAHNGDSAMLGQPQARAQTASERAAMAAQQNPQIEAMMRRRAREERAAAATRPASTRPAATVRPTTAPAGPTSGPAFGGPRGNQGFLTRALAFASTEGAALILTPSTQGDGGTFYVQNALIPGQSPFGGGATTRVWSPDAPAITPQVTVAVEDFNRVARMIERGQTPKILADLQVAFHDEDKMGYNTVAELPGTDLKDQIVMVGAHLDSWHSGTGATDNGVGSAAAMEAIRIIKAAGLHPRRTIRVALWTGEEQGLFGSAAYVKQHLGYDANPRQRNGFGPATRPARNIVKGDEFDRVSVYFNLDNGSGKIRGVYAQGNALAVPIFEKWLTPFHDLGAKTVTLSNTGSTDHISFDDIGIPGFQFIQDTIEYNTRTHHSNQDNYDRIQADDMKQASTILAAFLYDAAMMDEKFPRK